MLKNMLKNVVGAVAPTIGQALGGPLGGAAMNVVANALGCEPNARSVERAVKEATPEQLLALKNAELEFEVKMKELEVDVFALETADIQDARKNFARDWTAKFIAVTMVGGFLGYIFLVTLQPPEANSEALINLVLGYLGGLASAVISFYFGASNSNKE